MMKEQGFLDDGFIDVFVSKKMGDAFQIGKFYFECFIEVKEKQLVCSTHFPKW